LRGVRGEESMKGIRKDLKTEMSFFAERRKT
jgi:hypothetical protein